VNSALHQPQLTKLEMGTELEPTFWEEQNRTRTHVEKTYTELEPNQTHQCDEPEPSDPGSTNL